VTIVTAYATEGRTEADYDAILAKVTDLRDAVLAGPPTSCDVILMIPPLHTGPGSTTSADSPATIRANAGPIFENLRAACDTLEASVSWFTVVDLYDLTEGYLFDGTDPGAAAWLGGGNPYGFDFSAWDADNDGANEDTTGNLLDSAELHPLDGPSASTFGKLFMLSLQEAAALPAPAPAAASGGYRGRGRRVSRATPASDFT
jgi:hypothetical protein